MPGRMPSGSRYRGLLALLALALIAAGSVAVAILLDPRRAAFGRSGAAPVGEGEQGEQDHDERPRPAGDAGEPVAALMESTRAELYERARRIDLPGRSRMSKRELAEALARTDRSPDTADR